MDKTNVITISDRKLVEITGVADVISYNEEEIEIKTTNGELDIIGSNFNVKKLDVESGIMIIEGHLEGLNYNEVKESGTGVFKRLFKQ